jgi:DNA-binding winged helix-turn-helix (wHTH) protein
MVSAGATFGEWRFDLRNDGLSRRDRHGSWVPVAIGARAQDSLAVLLRDPGALVPKDVLMEAVWPGMAVEPNNLTVQIAALRRTLDEGQTGDSCIRTVPGRGYRFVRPVMPLEDVREPAPAEAALPASAPTIPALRPARRMGAVALVLALLLVPVSVWHWGWSAAPAVRPLSVVVMPFDNLGGNAAEDYLADAVTDDLRAGLALLPASTVVTREAAYA